MKTIIAKAIMTVMIVVAMVHYALYLKTGRIPWEGWQGPNISLPTSLPTTLPQAKNLLPGSKTRVYTWVDENGVTHYSQEPPPANVAGRELEVDSANVNVMQSVPIPAPESDSIVAPVSSPGGAEKAPLEKAREAAAMLEARNAQQEKILKSL